MGHMNPCLDPVLNNAKTLPEHMQGSSDMLSMSILNAAWPITAAAFDVTQSKLCWTYNMTFNYQRASMHTQ